jgi:hypothetical protein
LKRAMTLPVLIDGPALFQSSLLCPRRWIPGAAEKPIKLQT